MFTQVEMPLERKKYKTHQKEGVQSEWGLQKHELSAVYNVQNNRSFIVKTTRFLCILRANYPRSSVPSSPASLQGLHPRAAGCYHDSMGRALTALLLQLKILQENTQAGICAKSVCQ